MFSILVPTFNRADLLMLCLESIRSQSFKEYEVLILDDNSSDNTDVVANELCSLDSRFNYVKFDSNNGFSENIRWVIDNKINKSEWIIIVCDDDRLHTDGFLSRCANAINASAPNSSLLLVDLVYQYDIFLTNTKDDSALPYNFKKSELTENESKTFRNKFLIGFKHELFDKYGLYKTSGDETYEQPYEKLYANEYICYANDASYVFLIHRQNREKYLKIKQFIISLVLPELSGYKLLSETIGNQKAAEIIGDKIRYILTDTSSVVPSLIDFDLSFIANILQPLFSNYDACKVALYDFSDCLEKNFQYIIDDKLEYIGSQLVADEERKEMISRLGNFAIYGATDWGHQVASQLEDLGKHIICTIDDSNSRGCTIDEFCDLHADSTDAIIIASGRPHIILSMIENIKTRGIAMPILSIIPL